MTSLAVVCLLSIADAQVMQSGSYQIQSDSINAGGGLSSSGSYTQESTAGEIATGPSDSASYSLRAGYQQMQNVYIALSGATTTILSPALGGVSGGVSNGSTTVTVTTDNPAGYEMYLLAENSPAMQSGANTIANYSTSTPEAVFTYGSSDAVFGFTVEGQDIVSSFKDDGGGNCGVGVLDTVDTCWSSVSDVGNGTQVVSGSGSNHPLGATTTLKFRVGVGGTALPAPGTYVATTTLTVIPL